MEHVQETSSLISSGKVAGTRVFDLGGEIVGSIHDLMLDKITGKVAYAVMSFGGILGLGRDYHPLPWALLKYDRRRGGYVVDLSKTDLAGAPGYPVDTSPDWTNREFETRLHDYYGIGPYWLM